ncbi:MAG: O-antigen ligase family protein [Gemmatimonadota bacterium]
MRSNPIRRGVARPIAGPHGTRFSTAIRPSLPGQTSVRPYKLDLLRLGIAALIVLSLSRIHNHLGIGQLRPALLLTGLCGAMAVFNPRLVNAEKLLHYWPARVIVALGVVSCFSAAFGISLGASAVFILENYIKVIIVTFLIISGIRHAKDLSTFVWACVASCGILAYFAIFVFKVRVVGSGVARLNSLYTFDSNDVATILMSGLPLTLLAYQTSRGGKKVLAGVTLLGIGATMARSGSRGGFLALLAVGALLLFWVPGVSAVKRILFVGTVAIGLVIAAPPGYWEQMRTLTSLEEDYNWDSYYGRRKLAERGIGYMIRYPIFGVGIGNFPRADGTLSDRAQNFVERTGYANRWRSVHNTYVQAGSEMGVPGLALFVSLIIGGVVSMRRLRRRLPAAWARGDPDQRLIYYLSIYLPVSIVGFAVAAFFVAFAYLDPLYILMALVVGVHISLSEMRRRGAPGAPAPLYAGATRRPVPRPRSVTSPVMHG